MRYRFLRQYTSTNASSSLSDEDSVLASLEISTLGRSKSVGQFSLGFWYVAASMCLAFACGPTAATIVPSDEIATDDTTLGAGDVFAVRIYGQDDLSSTYRVAPDGSIDFPLVGRIEVGGQEPTAIADLIANRLQTGEILVAPQVSVLVEEYNSKRITVTGAVSRSGNIPMSAGLTVVQAISAAGGFTPLANRNGTVLTRRVEGELRRYNVNADRISQGRQQDVPVRAGDIIYVPERAF